MNQYGSSITRKTQAELENKWRKKLAQVNSRLAETETIKEYAAVLQNEAEWNSLSFCLRRYLYEHGTGRGREEEPVPFTMSAGGKTYSFHAVTPAAELTGQEKEAYADLLYRITVENECFSMNKEGVVNPKAGAISKKLYLTYLENKAISRKLLFVMSMALGFDSADMDDFMNAVGESPVYNFRNVLECIYYFCHNNEAYHTMTAVRGILREYGEALKRRSLPDERPALQTRLLRRGIDDITYGEFSDDEAMKEAFVEYLAENAEQFTEYSRTARKLLNEELESEKVLYLDYSVVRSSLVSGVKLRRYEESEDSLNRRTNVLTSNNTIGNEIYRILIEGVGLDPDEDEGEDWEDEQQPFRISEIDLDRRITANLLDGAHLRSVLFEEAAETEKSRKTPRETITKKDFLMLRLYKLGMSVDFSALTPKEHYELLQSFHSSTDRLLLKAGLPQIYAANPFEHMILTAVCSKDPLAFVPEIMRAAPRKGR